MKPATLGLLAGLTVVVVGGAWYATRSGSDGAGAATLPNRLFPEFAKRVNDVVTVEIEKGSERVTLLKKDNLWTLANRGGYPVDFEKIKQAVMAVSNLEVLEAKTKNPAQYDKLELQDPKEGAPSTRLTLRDAGGADLAAMIVGKSNWGGKASVYVRKLDDPQSYLCKGELRLESGPTTWIKKDVLKLDRERIRAVEVAHGDGETLRIQKQQLEDADFVVLDIPPTRELASAGVAGQLGSALTWVSVDDVAPMADVGFDGLSVTTATFRTFDGLVVEMRLADKDAKSYAAIKATWEEPPARPAPSESQPASAASAKLKSADAVRQEIDELNGSHGAWAYVLPSYKATGITKRMNDMLAPLPEPDAPIDSSGGSQPANTLPPGHTADDGHDH